MSEQFLVRVDGVAFMSCPTAEEALHHRDRLLRERDRGTIDVFDSHFGEVVDRKRVRVGKVEPSGRRARLKHKGKRPRPWTGGETSG